MIDEVAVALGQDLAVLMQRASAAIAREAQRLAPTGTILVACGPGNNGGDGYGAARLLAEAGREVCLWPIQRPTSPFTRQLLDDIPSVHRPWVSRA